MVIFDQVPMEEEEEVATQLKVKMPVEEEELKMMEEKKGIELDSGC